MTTYADLSKGSAWEYRVMRAAFLSGWYVRRGVNLRERVRSSPQTMAEIDILGIGFDAALTPRTLAGECKDRKGGTKEADRIIWVLGLSRLLRADHVLFAKRTLTDATIQFAQPVGVLLWDQAAVQHIEMTYELSPESRYFGSANVGLQEDLLRPARKASAIGHRPLRSAWDFVSGAFWYQPTPARTKALAGYFDALLGARLGGDARSSFVAEGLIALLVSAYTTAGQLLRRSPARGDQLQESAFASGVADATALREIAARADDYYQDALQRTMKARGDAASELRVPRLANTIAQPPPWMAAYLSLARRLGEAPAIAGDTLRYADIVLFEHLLAGNTVSDLLARILPSDHDALHANLQLGALFLERVWGVSDPLLDRLIALSPKKPVKTRRRSSTPSQSAEASLFDPV